MAVTERRGKEELTFWVDVTAWGKQAETVCQYVRKGSKVGVVGRLTEDQWSDKSTGEKRRKLKVTADNVEFLSRSNGGEDQRPANANYGEEPQTGGGAESDDIPF